MSLSQAWYSFDIKLMSWKWVDNTFLTCLTFLHSFFNEILLKKKLHTLTHIYTYMDTHKYLKFHFPPKYNSIRLSDVFPFILSCNLKGSSSHYVIFISLQLLWKSPLFISWDLPSTSLAPLFRLVSSFLDKHTLLGKSRFSSTPRALELSCDETVFLKCGYNAIWMTSLFYQTLRHSLFIVNI